MSQIISNGNGFTKPLDCHLGRITLNNLKKWKDGIHQVELSYDEVNTHEEVRLRSVRVARGLQTRGLGVGDLIVICGNTHNDLCLPILASFYIGSTIFPFCPNISVSEVKRFFENGIPKIIFCDPFMERTFTRALQELNIHVEIVIFGDVHRDSDTSFITPFSKFLEPTGTEDSFEVIDFDPRTTVAAVISSSGSTGFPKGVCLTHHALFYRNHLSTMWTTQYDGSSLLMSFTNYFWITAMSFLLSTCLSGIPRINCALPFSVNLLTKGLTKYKPRTLFLNPVIMHDLIKNPSFEELDFSSLKSFVVGGCPVSDDIIFAMKAKLKNGVVTNTFGSSEAGSVSKNTGDKTASLGKPYPWIDWKVVSTKSGKKVNFGEDGELCVKSKMLFKCYLNNPKTTRDAFDEDGYFKTGDLVSIDEEGYMYFIDRVKELIFFKNYQVTPTEIELEIRKLPEVLQVCVVGIKHEEDGEHPVAFVQKSKGSTLTEQDIKDVVKYSLADYKQLSGGVVFLENLPETPSGKINRIYLKEVAQKLMTMNKCSKLA